MAPRDRPVLDGRDRNHARIFLLAEDLEEDVGARGKVERFTRSDLRRRRPISPNESFRLVTPGDHRYDGHERGDSLDDERAHQLAEVKT